MFKFLRNVREYSDNKARFQSYKSEELDFIKYQENKDEFDRYLKSKKSFEQYSEIAGRPDKPHFIMYASDIDATGNVTFKYDFNEDFINTLRKQGIQGINDIEVLEAYLHLVFSQVYFAEMLKPDEEKQ